MRAFDLRGSSLRFFGWALPLVAGAFGAAACADSIHLDPAGSTGGKGSTTTTTPGTGGGPAAECRSNPECSYPTPICDAVTNKCVECLVQADCSGAKPGTVCSAGACVCAASGSASLSFCPALGAEGPRCVDMQTSPSDCGQCGRGCFGSCAAGKCADPWTKITTNGAPSPRTRHVSVWTGSRMFVWGGVAASGATNTGGLYDPVTDSWSPVSLVDAPSPRSEATAVWDPIENVVVVWGGLGANGNEVGTGALYHPSTNSWTPMKTDNAPSPRRGHSAVWATFGSAKFLGALDHGVIIWGGRAGSSSFLGDGMVFDAAGNSWSGPLDTNAAPLARADHTAVWDDLNRQMIVFGGSAKIGSADQYFADGGVFSGGTNTWAALNAGGPSARARHAAAWDPTGHAMYVMGGFDQFGGYPGEISQYLSGAWMTQAAAATPEGREGHTAVWVDKAASLVVFGGSNGSGFLASTWSVGSTLVWKALPSAPAARAHHTAVTDGTVMMIWGGDGQGGFLGDGAILTP